MCTMTIKERLLLHFALEGIAPAGWGMPAIFEYEGWTPEEYTVVFNQLMDWVESDERA